MGKADIYIDEQGRRRVNRQQGPAMPSQEELLQNKIAALEKLCGSLQEKLDGMTITGDGFSGSGPNGISYSDPKKEKGSGGGGDAPEIPAPPGSGEYVLVSTDGSLSWELIENCEDEEEE